MYCKNCGQKVTEGSKFCKNCGTATPTVQVDQPVQPVKPVTPEVVLSKNNRKGWWIGGIIGGVVIILLIIILALASDNTTTSSSTTASPQTINANNSQSVVDILCDTGNGGSGTIFTADGTVLTNNHVIKGATICQVTIPNPSTGQIAEVYNATPIVTPTLSKEYDIATLKIDGAYKDNTGKTYGLYPTTFQAFTLPSTCSTSTPSQLGDSILIYGYPVTSGGYNLTITNGIISSFADDGDILTSAKVDSGNSGGLAVDQNGCWLGIPSAVISGNYQNLGVIIPGSVVENILANVPAKAQPFAPKADTDASQASSGETNDQQCQDDFGTYSQWSGNMDSNGNPTCECQNGYSWDATGNACATQTSLQGYCQSTYGSESYSYTSGGKAVCGCSAGYTLNSAQTECVASEETNDEQCQDSYGAGSEWNGELNSQSGPTCDCQSGYIWNSTQTACILQPTCPLFSTYDSSTGQCTCESGYTMSGSICESDDMYCENQDGFAATYDSASNSCTCMSGYISSGGQCVSEYSYCTERWGLGAEYDSATNSCECMIGYEVNSTQTGCVLESLY